MDLLLIYDITPEENAKLDINMGFIFCKLEKAQKTWISCFASLKNLKKHEFHVLQA